jgi:hypothetical protein
MSDDKVGPVNVQWSKVKQNDKAALGFTGNTPTYALLCDKPQRTPLLRRPR